jgi:hypothetical protein
MAFDDERRFLAGRRRMVRIGRRIVICVGGEAVLGREGEMLRDREIAAQRVVVGRGRGAAQHLDGAIRRIDQGDRRRIGGRPGAADDAAAGAPDRAEIGIGQINGDEVSSGDV